MLPAFVFSQEQENNSIKAKDHPLYDILHDAPNNLMDSFTFFETMVGSMIDHGASFNFIQRTKTEELAGLLPLDAARIQTKVVDNELLFKYSPMGSAPESYRAKDIFRVLYNSKDGVTGRTPIQTAAETFGFSLALQQHGNQLFENGAFMSGFLKVPFVFKDSEARSNFMDSFKKYFGAKNAGKAALLEQGADYVPFSMNNRDAQFIESKKLSVLDIARIMRVPPHMIQELEHGTSFASVEQHSINFIQHTIQPWLTRIEKAINFQLLRSKIKKAEKYFVKFNAAALLRGDLKSQTESLVMQIQYGLKTINEARELLDSNRVSDAIADNILLSHNLVPAQKAVEQSQNLLKGQSNE